MNLKKLKEIYCIDFDDEIKRDVNPLKLRNFRSDKCNEKVEELITDSKNGFSLKLKRMKR